eukprot:2113294-Alexandrium_andersonii.AAC.1
MPERSPASTPHAGERPLNNALHPLPSDRQAGGTRYRLSRLALRRGAPCSAGAPSAIATRGRAR